MTKSDVAYHFDLEVKVVDSNSHVKYHDWEREREQVNKSREIILFEILEIDICLQ